jgi:TRAP-type C4-dicarboxylate transport system permease small subunit
MATLDRLERLAGGVAGASLVGVVCVQSWQVFARYVLNASPSWTEPVALLLVANAALLGAAIGARKETHFAFPVLVDAAPPVVADVLRAASRLVMLALGLGLVIFGARLTIDAMGVTMAGAPIPAGLRFAPMALGGLLIAVFSLERLLVKRTPGGEG